MLTCNYRKCRQLLGTDAIATSCQHIFCATHSPLHLKTSDGMFQCPACKSRLHENTDIYEVNLKPCEQFRGMILIGQTPETVLDICRRAIGFYSTQTAQEVKYLEYAIYKLQEEYKSTETQFKSVLSNYGQKVKSLQNERDSLQKECEELRDKLVSSSHKLSKLESDLNQLNLSRRSESTHTCHSGHGLPSSGHSNMSPDTQHRKFPRCSPDSTRPSPFSGNSRCSQMSFCRRQEPTTSTNCFLANSSRQSTPNLVFPNHFLNGGIRNLTNNPRKPLYK
uniref:RING-type domain-containing protein n=1 Tax=Trichobilharzia regenti TaxID=157069 RepID=A0AA85IVJ5_TRIRE|nr:unnamed protein product [Trichobilharzia regenti]